MFTAFMQANQAKLFRFVLKAVGNRADAEDLVQQTFLEAYRHEGSFRGESQRGTWLFGIAVNLMRNHFNRGHNRRRSFLSDEAMAEIPSADDDPAQALGRKQRLQELDAAIALLPPEWREVLILVRMEDKSYEETAAILAIPIGTVRSRLNRASDRLRVTCRAYAPELITGGS
jgi:RNA polymerase sigma factor (sigma-70 family)